MSETSPEMKQQADTIAEGFVALHMRRAPNMGFEESGALAVGVRNGLLLISDFAAMENASDEIQTFLKDAFTYMEFRTKEILGGLAR
jgi:hypothetical protein